MDKPKKNPSPLSSYDPPYRITDKPVQIDAPDYVTNNIYYKKKDQC